MVDKRSVLWPEWRIRLLGKLEIVLAIFELVLSVIFISVSYITSNLYFKGVGVGLLIAGVTSLIAYLFKIMVPKGNEKGLR